MNDGPKNRLRSQDLHKIVDVFNKQIELDRYSRMVPNAEIADPKNDFNLNIPRYIDSSAPEDLQDLDAHLHGGVPDRDIDALGSYWDAFPQLRSQLFKPNRPRYVDLAVDVVDVRQAILDSSEFQQLAQSASSLTIAWFAAHSDALSQINADTRPSVLIANMGDDLLARFKSVPLIGEYDVYEQLMTYWHSSMHDDVFLIMNEGWVAASKPRTAIEDKERKLSETPDLILGAGKNATKLKMDLIPLELIVSRYFAVDRVHLDGLTAQAEAALRAVEEYVEEHGDDDGLLFDAVNDKGKVSQSSVKDLLKEAKSADDTETVDCAKVALDLLQAEAAAKKAAKDALEVLNSAAFKKYGELDEPEVQAIVLQDKWAKSLSDRVAEEINALTLRLVARIQDLGDRYAETLDDIEVDLSQLEAKVSMHLEDMGVR